MHCQCHWQHSGWQRPLARRTRRRLRLAAGGRRRVPARAAPARGRRTVPLALEISLPVGLAVPGPLAATATQAGSATTTVCVHVLVQPPWLYSVLVLGELRDDINLFPLPVAQTELHLVVHFRVRVFSAFCWHALKQCGHSQLDWLCLVLPAVPP